MGRQKCTMAEVEDVPEVEEGEEENYQPPPEKSIDALMEADQDDEALRKYKETLLGQAAGGSGTVVVDESDPRKVIVKALALVVEGRDDEVIDLTQSLAEIKKLSFTLKEGVKFRIRIDFVMQRGTYSINSLFTDDDKNEHLKWEWSLEIKKDWARKPAKARKKVILPKKLPKVLKDAKKGVGEPDPQSWGYSAFL